MQCSHHGCSVEVDFPIVSMTNREGKTVNIYYCQKHHERLLGIIPRDDRDEYEFAR